MTSYILTDVEENIIELKRKHNTTWRDKPSWFWYLSLLEEVIELGLSLIGLHKDPPQWELNQISSIAANWYERLDPPF